MSLKKLMLASGAFLLIGAAHVSTAISAQDCPRPQRYEGGCIQVIVWAKDPATGICCEYPNPCSAPTGWTTYSSASACAGA